MTYFQSYGKIGNFILVIFAEGSLYECYVKESQTSGLNAVNGLVAAETIALKIKLQINYKR